MMDLDNNFFDRRSIIDLLKRRVIDLKEGYRQNLAFLGNRYIGKTSILNKFINDLDDEVIVPIYVDMDQKDIYYLFSKFVGSMLYNFSKFKKLILQDDIDLLMESTKKTIPQTVEEIRKIKTNLAKGKLTEAYRDLISLPEIFTSESGMFCMIILDEFHNLEELTVSNVFQELGKRIMTQKRCIYIVTSSLSGVAKKILSEKLSLLFGNFESVPITAFDLKTSQAFIEQNLRGIRIGASLRNFLIDFMGGHPFYLNIISHELIHLSILHKQNEVYLPLLTQAIENTIFNRWGIISRHFEFTINQLCNGKGNRILPAILISLANGKHKLLDISKDVELTKNVIIQKMNRLVDLGIVCKNGNFFHYEDKLIKYWIKYVYQKKLKAIDADPERQREQFKMELIDLINNFTVVSSKDLSSRIVELLHCFDNEFFNFNGRKYKLPLFNEITPLKADKSAPYGFHVIRATSSEGVWFIIFKEDTLCENDVNVFLTESKKLDEKPQRQIIISLSELDANARLRALQERMWIWNEKEINTLLTLFDKPYIMK